MVLSVALVLGLALVLSLSVTLALALVWAQPLLYLWLQLFPLLRCHNIGRISRIRVIDEDDDVSTPRPVRPNRVMRGSNWAT